MAMRSRRFGKFLCRIDITGILFARENGISAPGGFVIDIIGRIAAIDYGLKRIGLAISDAEQKLATPAGMIDGSGSPARDAVAVARWAAENEAAGIIVGMPLHMDGGAGQQAGIASKFGELLRKNTPLPVEMWDERLTSYQADVWMSALSMTAQQRARRRDTLAATAILQSYLTRDRGGAAQPETP